MKTIIQALLDEIYYPIPLGFVENKLLERNLQGDEFIDIEVIHSNNYKGALADCLVSLVQAVSITEADKTVNAMTDTDKQRILCKANKLYAEIGEAEVDLAPRPIVYIN